ncbi:MAG: hypothetical protein K2G63_01215 [Oscillospiraceae bacterium]|nr:hypothetical protein [Oscillospiraceae bacterium]
MENNKTHWKKLTNPNYLGNYALPVDGGDLIAVIDYVCEEKVTGIGGKTENEIVAHFKGGIKPMILNKTNMKTIQKVCKSPYIEDWRGCAIQIYYDSTVRFGRETVGGLRIRDFVPQVELSLICAECGVKITESFGKKPKSIAEYTRRKYGKELCADCAGKARTELEKRKAPDPFANKEDKNNE